MKSAFGQIFDLLKDYRKQIVLGVLLSLLPAYFKVWIPLILGKAIDEGLSQTNTNLFFSLAFLFLGIQLFLFFLQYLTNFFLSHFGLNILVGYRAKLLNRILSYKVSFFDRLPAGKISTRLSNDVNSLQELFSSALVVLVGNAVTLVGVVIAMFVLNWKLALIAVTVVPFLIWLVKFFQTRIRRTTGFMRKSMSNLNAYAGESFNGLQDIRGLGARDKNREEFNILSKKLARRHYQTARQHSLFNPSIFFITSMMSVVVLLGGALFLEQGQGSVGSIAAFLTYVNFFAWPVQELAEKYSVLQQSLGAIDRLVEISSGEPEENFGAEKLSSFETIEFQKVCFSYQAASVPALNHVSFKVKRGQKIALIGETGAGKTTTCALLMRFYQPSTGQILFDGEDYRKYELENFRSQIGWVSQDVFLFSTSLRENLRFYNEAISDEEIWYVLEILELHSWAKALNGGLDFKLTERGGRLSSGQKQLLSLARALLVKPKILVFDEATSHIDSHTEFLIQESLEHMWKTEGFKNVTGFVIAHRLSTVRLCDRIFAFQKAQIIEQGSYEELMSQKGYTFQLQEKQFREKPINSNTLIA